jgi:NAD(P)-dependent dehydrogenase (short-subunit alcohol dehydrogenase family)
MRERGDGHVVNIGTMGTQTLPPQFAAYVASKAALDAFTKVAAAESGIEGVRFTTVHMPLVRTPMIEPTEAYKDLPALSPEQAAEMVARALRDRPRTVGTSVGTLSEIGHALTPGITGRVKRAAVGPRKS